MSDHKDRLQRRAKQLRGGTGNGHTALLDITALRKSTNSEFADDDDEEHDDDEGTKVVIADLSPVSAAPPAPPVKPPAPLATTSESKPKSKVQRTPRPQVIVLPIAAHTPGPVAVIAALLMAVLCLAVAACAILLGLTWYSLAVGLGALGLIGHRIYAGMVKLSQRCTGAGKFAANLAAKTTVGKLVIYARRRKSGDAPAATS